MEKTSNGGSVILVPFDGSSLAEHAIGYAAGLAVAGDTILVVQVVGDQNGHAEAPGELSIKASKEGRNQRTATPQSLERLAARAAETHPELRISSLVAVGDPAEQILKVAMERNAHLIVMTSRGRGALGRLAFGSVADRVARTAEIPVVIVRTPETASAPIDARVRRLMVPLDGSDLAGGALPIAERLARQLRVPILVVTVVDSVHVFTLPLDYASAFSQHVYEEMLDDARSNARDVVAEASDRLRREGLSVEEQILSGPAAASLMDASGDGDLMVMTSHGRGGFRRWLLGSVAEKLVREGPVPLMLVRSATPIAELELARE